MNGWLAKKWVWNNGLAHLNPKRAVAAAASLPVNKQIRENVNKQKM